MNEIENAIDIIIAQPACSRFISKEIASYFIGTAPPDSLIEKMAKTFQESGGDIKKTISTLLESKEFISTLGKTYKDPYRFLIGSVRAIHDGNTKIDTATLSAWLKMMEESQFNRLTPDGYPLDKSVWSGSGAMITRFNVTRRLVAHLPATGRAENRNVGLDPLIEKLYPLLKLKTQQALESARSPRKKHSSCSLPLTSTPIEDDKE